MLNSDDINIKQVGNQNTTKINCKLKFDVHDESKYRFLFMFSAKYPVAGWLAGLLQEIKIIYRILAVTSSWL
jgi:hypothetical protein